MTSSRPLSVAEQQRRFQCVVHDVYSTRCGRPQVSVAISPARARPSASSASISTCSCSACAPSPTAPRPSKVGNPERGGEVSVRAAAGAAFGQLLPQFARRRPAPARTDARPPQNVRAAADRIRRSRSRRDRGSYGAQRRERGFDALGVSAAVATRTSIDRARLVGDHVGSRAARDTADVDDDAARRILQRVDADDLLRQLVNRARALLRIDPGMRRDAADDRARSSPTPLRAVFTRRRAATARAPAPRRSRRASSSISARECRCRSPRRSSTA